MQKHLKLHFIIIALLFSLAINSCNTQGTSHKELSNHSGRIIIYFVDTLMQAEAEKFTHDLNLTLIERSRVENGHLRSAIIQVPVGNEQAWVDSLKSYVTFVKQIGVIVNDDVGTP